MKTALLAAAAATASVLGGFGVVSVAHADPAMCQFLGQHYNMRYPCGQYQPWLPYGTADNPPLSGPPLGDCTDSIQSYSQACWRP